MFGMYNVFQNSQLRRLLSNLFDLWDWKICPEIIFNLSIQFKSVCIYGYVIRGFYVTRETDNSDGNKESDSNKRMLETKVGSIEELFMIICK